MAKKIIIFLGMFFGLLTRAGFISALEVHNYPSFFGLSINDTSSLSQYTCYIFALLTSLAITIAVFSIVFGGVYYLVSYGRGKFTSEAKEWIKAGILGLLIVLCTSLIAYTINPNLTTCKIGVLALLPTITSTNSPTAQTNPNAVNYKEIPIGSLTESLLTRTTGCYGFDQEGNFVEGDQVKTDNNKTITGPTYLDHDRADCLLQLIDGAQKKSQVIASLSAEITKLMNSCDCKKYGNCTPANSQCDQPQDCFAGQTCAGPAVGGSCFEPQNQQPPDCCPAGIKDKIEGKNGKTIDMELNVGSGDGFAESCTTKVVKYKGLEEFRSQFNNDFNQIKSKLEPGELPRVDKKEIWTIDKTAWDKLVLIDQLTYLKGKIDYIKQKIQADKDQLNSAKSLLASLKNCYMALPYVDFLKTKQNTDQQARPALSYKIFSDPDTQTLVDASKYCTGFNYSNSSCLNKCDNECPDTSATAINCYKACTQSGSAQEVCTEKCYNQRPCLLSSNTGQNFGDCISSCQGDCATDCAKKYLECSSEYEFCKSQCDNNSKCVLDNADSCLFSNSGFQQCAGANTDQANTDYCIENAYLCKNGSNQNAGYSDCVDTKISGCSITNYSASSLYKSFLNGGTGCEKCQDPLSSSSTGAPICQKLYPETAKCPTSSKCGTCPCNQINNQTINFYIPDTAIGEYKTSSEKVSAYQIVGPQCSGYSYNDDPLIFYCQDNWVLDPTKEGTNPIPIGKERICPRSGEIPVGQTVDDAQNWASWLIKNADDAKQDIQKIIDQTDKIGKAKNTNPIQNYCKCDAKFDTNKPICKTDCSYSQWVVSDPIFDDTGTQIGSTNRLECACAPLPCDGSPCEQITNYLAELWNDVAEFRTNFIQFYTSMLTEPRSDTMKELTYSRNTTNNGSLTAGAYGTQTRLIDCTRVKDEIISPVNSGNIIFDGKEINAGCYGQGLGNIVGQSLTDNWFCCQEYTKTPTLNNNPIYNIQK